MASLHIKQIKSTIKCKKNQKLTIKALGLRKLHQEVTLPDNPQTRGMVNVVKHLVSVRVQ